MHTTWKSFFDEQKNQLYYLSLCESVKKAYQKTICYPPQDQIFHAFRITPLETIQVVILGQDPYHGKGQAHGLAFSVQKRQAIPPSLRNMYLELQDDIGVPMPVHGNLEAWAKQGVFLLNQVLTVEESKPNSHKGFGWEEFTNRVIECINAQDRKMVFVLWGSHAQKKLPLIDQTKHYVIQSPHPSPLSAHRGFFGSRPFSRINRFLVSQQQQPIAWQLI